MSKAIKAVGIIEIIGGVIGISFAALAAKSFLSAPGGAVSLALFAGVSACSIVAGILLLRRKRAGVLLSRAVLSPLCRFGAADSGVRHPW